MQTRQVFFKPEFTGLSAFNSGFGFENGRVSPSFSVPGYPGCILALTGALSLVPVGA